VQPSFVCFAAFARTLRLTAPHQPSAEFGVRNAECEKKTTVAGDTLRLGQPRSGEAMLTFSPCPYSALDHLQPQVANGFFPMSA